MKREEQTPEILVELCNLTKLFTKKLQPQYYYQYRGDIYDLAMEFYCDFLTAKGRGDVKESLLDKYDPSVTSLAYLVKVAVTRKLIDRSRVDQASLTSIDKLVEDFGDLITKVFNLSEDPFEDSVENDEFFKKRLISSYSKLDDVQKNQIFAKLYDASSELTKLIKPVFTHIHGCPVQQITDKTVVLYIPEARKCINFALDDGHPRGKIRPFVIDTTGLSKYHSGFERDLFEDFHNSNK